MSFRKDKTTSANASLMTAGGIVEALVAKGVIATTKGAGTALTELAQKGLDFAGPIVDADNALFESVEGKEAAAPRTTRKAPGKKVDVPDEPGEVVFFGGKFKGCTINEVYSMTEEDAKENYGHPYGAGSTYITNYVATDKNTNDTTREAAKVFLAARTEG